MGPCQVVQPYGNTGAGCPRRCRLSCILYALYMPFVLGRGPLGGRGWWPKAGTWTPPPPWPLWPVWPCVLAFGGCCALLPPGTVLSCRVVVGPAAVAGLLHACRFRPVAVCFCPVLSGCLGALCGFCCGVPVRVRAVSPCALSEAADRCWALQPFVGAAGACWV